MLRDAIFNSPGSLLLGCGAMLPLMFWIVGLIHWMIMGDIDFVSGLLGCAVGLVLGYLAMAPPHPSLAPLFFLAIVAVVVLFPIIRHLLNKRDLVAIDVEAMESCYDILADKPDNVGSLWRLARILYQRGFEGQALAVGRRAMDNVPPAAFQEELGTLTRWTKNTPPGSITPLPCLECGFQNPPDQVRCGSCGKPHLIPHIQGRWLGPQAARRLILAWIAGTVALVGIPTLAVSADVVLAALTIPFLFAMAVFTVWLAFRKEAPSIT